MHKDILQAPFVRNVMEVTANMYRLGWAERNGGNVSVLLEENEVKEYLDVNDAIRTFDLSFDASPIAGRCLIVTGTGKYFRNVEKDPADCLGIIKIGPNGKTASLLWGFSREGAPTSELPTHIKAHIARLASDPRHRVVIHTHATYATALTFCLEEDERAISRILWGLSTECLIVFPEGIGYLPWMVCGNNAIGEATAAKMSQYRLVLWSMHGIYATGTSIDEAFGLIETVDKAAQLYFITENSRKREISDGQLRSLGQAFKVKYDENILGGKNNG